MADRIEEVVFSFEDTGEKLSLLPLAARRALDVSGLRLSLEGYQSLPYEDRVELALLGGKDQVDTASVERLVRTSALPPTRIKPVIDPDPRAPPDQLNGALGPKRALDPLGWQKLRAIERYALVHVMRRSIAHDDPSRLESAVAVLLPRQGGAARREESPASSAMSDGRRAPASLRQDPRRSETASWGGAEETPFDRPSRAGSDAHDRASRSGREESPFDRPSRSGREESPFDRPSRSGREESPFDRPSRSGREESPFDRPSRGVAEAGGGKRQSPRAPEPATDVRTSATARSEVPASSNLQESGIPMALLPSSMFDAPRRSSPPPARKDAGLPPVLGSPVSSRPPPRESLSRREPPSAISTHLGEDGHLRMVSVGDKEITHRRASATGYIQMSTETARRLAKNDTPKGDVLATARVAGVMAAKRTPELIPLCHHVTVTSVEVQLDLDANTGTLQVMAVVEAVDRTGVEMEALTAVSVSCLTIYDMLKGIDRDMVIGEIKLASKSGGRSGPYVRGDR
ncbi:MAG: cyclic pyranopterin monophosphate synthase MoaC [Polyangiaceae bacterium]|nr:cyclic pyranopterin monophosphate synthase MoaC [Polyangiaceae bacterium]